jgi:hypothetical protein
MAGAAFAAPFSSEKGGFSIDLPAGLEPMPKEQMEPMEASGTYLMATDQKAMMEGKNLSVTGVKAATPESVSISDFAAAQVQQAQALPNVKGDVKSELKNFGGLEWAKTAYEMDAGGMTIFMAQYTAFSGDFMLSFTFTGTDMNSDESVFDSSMETFKLQ